MTNLYKIYKFFKGEENAPENMTAEQGRLWNAERVFEKDFKNNDSSDWYAFFKDFEKDGKNAGQIFMAKLNEDEEERPAETSKAWIFDLWVNYYLFVDKFPASWREIYDKGV